MPRPSTSCTSPAGTWRRLRARARTARRRHRGAAGRAGPARRRARAGLVGLARARLSPDPRGGPGGCCATCARSTRIQADGDPREHPFHCHHEKTIMIDGELAFVGGIDLTDAAGDRYDTQAHHARRRLGWHDVATRLRGPAVADVDDHFRAALARADRRAAARTDARRHRPASSTVQVVRTVAEDMYDALPHGDFRIFESYRRALRSAQRADLPREPVPVGTGDRLDPRRQAAQPAPPRLPDRDRCCRPSPTTAATTRRGQLGVLIDADDGHGRLLAATIRSLSPAGTAPTRCTCTPRWRSWTTAG